jgi:phage replication-related protein YjqB (UPF0714/DUF867 family)
MPESADDEEIPDYGIGLSRTLARQKHGPQRRGDRTENKRPAQQAGVSHRRLTTHPVAVTDTGHLVELLYDDGQTDDLLFCAGHGGDVEPGTAELSMRLATGHETAACWATLGHEGEGSAFDTWHPPSKAIDPEEYPLLARIADRGFETVVSIHGLADDEVLVGGALDEATKTQVADRLDAALSVPVSVARDSQYAGTHPENFVNWLAAADAGLQLELGPTARGPETGAVADAVRSLLDRGLR